MLNVRARRSSTVSLFILLGLCILFAAALASGGANGASHPARPATKAATVATAATDPGKPSPDQIEVATRVGLVEAGSTSPENPGVLPDPPLVPGDPWPEDVNLAAMVVDTRGHAQPYVSAGESDDPTPVVVVQLLGDFAVQSGHPGPVGSEHQGGGVAKGQVMMVVADAKSGQVLDFGLEPSSDPSLSLPDAYVLFRR